MHKCSFAMLALALSLPLSGCIGTDWGDDLADGASEPAACAAGSVAVAVGSAFENVRSGEEDRVDLVGLCSSFEACDESSPLMLGSEHEIVVAGDPNDSRAVSFESLDPTVVLADETGATCHIAEGTLSAAALGTAVVVVSLDGVATDRFVLEVAAPTSLSLSAPSADDPAMPLLVPGEVALLQATVRDSDGRTLAARNAIAWTFQDDGVLELTGDDPLHALGGAQFVKARAAGTTTVHARVGTFEATLVITVN